MRKTFHCEIETEIAAAVKVVLEKHAERIRRRKKSRHILNFHIMEAARKALV